MKAKIHKIIADVKNFDTISETAKRISERAKRKSLRKCGRKTEKTS